MLAQIGNSPPERYNYTMRLIEPLLLLSIITVSPLSSFAQEQGTLTVVIDNVKSEKGKMNIAVCSTPEQYLSDTNIFKAVRVKPARGETKVVFANIPYGDYAVKVYQDKNNNGKLDTGFFGIPKEPYGFSNDPKIKRGMPSFKETSFKVGSENKEITIRMR